jgi:hypothetical protein
MAEGGVVKSCIGECFSDNQNIRFFELAAISSISHETKLLF